jgi:GT2 family glycosyltransferase
MSEKNLKPTVDPSRSEEHKPAEVRNAQVRQGKERLAKGAQKINLNPVVTDETYGGLREEERVVMRHQIALNLDSFRAAPEEFTPRPNRTYPPLAQATPPFCSVIIPNYNGQRFLPTLLAALQKQTFQDFEIILADDASPDNSVAQVEAEYHEVRLLVNRQNQGFARTCNAAVDAAVGRVVVLLNNDTEPEPTWLGELVKAVCAHPDVAIFASKMLLFNERNMLHTTGDFIGADGIPRNRGVWELDWGQYDQQTEIFSGSGGGSAFRKDVWQALGGFDEDFWMYLEDVDYGFRARLMGWRAVFVPTARLYHHLSATGGGVLASYYVGRNTIWNIAKNMPRGLLLRNLPKILAGQLTVTWDALRHIRGAAARARLRGQIAGILGLPRQLQKRKVVQARRRVENADLARQII